MKPLIYSFLALSLLSGLHAKEALNPTPLKPDGKPHTFKADTMHFSLDGSPVQLISGEMHYPRVPKEYWRDRMKRMKAMGCNTLSTYVFWNVHEPRPGEWDFSANNDLAEYCKIAQEEGLWVIIRPGPYVCAEWEFGGYPSWLLKNRDLIVRSQEPHYKKASEAYLKKVASILSPLQAANGGPIILVQLENEYGAYGNDKDYLRSMVDAMKEGGFDKVQFYTADQANEPCLKNGTLPDLPATLTFGGGAEQAFDLFRKIRPEGPLMNSEFWCGWFDHWGATHNERDTSAYNKGFKWMLENEVSVNFFVVHGGTSFAFMPGANGGVKITPDITSYDYSAPISECGKLTDRFYAFRKTAQDYIGKELPAPPADPEMMSLLPLSFKDADTAGMFDSLPKPVESPTPICMEDLDQSYGFVLYRTEVKGPLTDAPLKMTRLMDRAIVYVDGVRQGTADRRHGQEVVKITVPKGTHQLDILVENLARINYGSAITTERKGITEKVTLDNKELTNFKHYSLPCEYGEPKSSPKTSPRVDKLVFTQDAPKSDQPVFYKKTLKLDKVADTYLDMQDGWKKGVVWVNGHNLGRYWFVGPQQALYCPAPFLKQGDNEIIVLELEGGIGAITGVTEQIWKTNDEPNAVMLNRKPGETITPAKDKLVHTGSFSGDEDWQNVRFDKVVEGQFFAIEPRSALDGQNFAAIAEIDILDENGKLLDKDKWSISYADSEEYRSESGLAHLAFDRQPVTFWHTEWSKDKPKFPHLLILNLNAKHKISGFRYLARPGASGGKVKDYAVYISPTPFPAKKE